MDDTQIKMAQTRRLLANGMDWSLVTGLRNRFYLKCFVETGTAGGVTAIDACTVFNQVYSIEADAALFETAKQRGEECNNLQLMFGQSIDLLPQICEKVKEPILFYLDAHWSGGEPTELPECPIIEEIRIIRRRWPEYQDVVIVDDANLFLKIPPEPRDPKQWPKLEAIVCEAREACPSLFADLVVNQLVISPEPLFGAW